MFHVSMENLAFRVDSMKLSHVINCMCNLYIKHLIFSEKINKLSNRLSGKPNLSSISNNKFMMMIDESLKSIYFSKIT